MGKPNTKRPRRTRRNPSPKRVAKVTSVRGNDEEPPESAYDIPEHVLRLVGPDAVAPAGTYFELMLFQRQHEDGDRLALPQCLVFCEERQAAVPPWARKALAEAFAQYLADETVKLDQVLMGASPKGGRHTNPRKAARDRETALLVYAAVQAAALGGHAGDKKFWRAQEVLKEKCGLYLTAETIKKYYAKKRPGKWEWTTGWSLGLLADIPEPDHPRLPRALRTPSR